MVPRATHTLVRRSAEMVARSVASSRPAGTGRVTGSGKGARSPAMSAQDTAVQQQSPFSLIQSQQADVQAKTGTKTSIARHNFDASSEAQLNEQINVELTASYTYQALYAHFDRDDVALPGTARFFKAMSLEERGHGEQFMAYQNTRGGRVQLFPVQLPPMPDLENPNGKPDLLDALEFALAVEKFTYQKLLELHNVADEAGDAQMCDFVESNFLQDQVDSVKAFSERVSIVSRLGDNGLGVYYFDRELNQVAEQQEQNNAA